MNNSNKKFSNSSASQKEKLFRDASKIEAMWAGLDKDVDSELTVYTNRHEVPPPEARDKSKYNPLGIVDIEIFISHPYYLNLQPYPWQVLALKLFYAGSEGNSNLIFNDSKKEESTDCESCIWNYIQNNETDCAEKINKNEYYQSILNPLNSRCLKCSRCPLSTRNIRLNHEIDKASDITIENMLKDILSETPEDLFQSEFDLIDEITDEAVKLQIINKLKNKFQELVLIIGRRGSKSFLTVCIALYELYKLLSMGHPQKHLKLPDTQEIHILNVAKNEEQAKDSIFTPMKNYAMSSPFFEQYIGTPNELEVKFLTDHDIKENIKRAEKGINPLPGTITLKCGSSSGGGLVGKTCWCIILDELAAMAGDNPNSGLDKKLYNDLKPSISTFAGDGKIINLSNPKGPFGKLFDLYNTRLEDRSTLILKLPTWHINANIDKLWLEEERKKDPIEFNMQYGAEFGTNSQDPYLSPEDVDYAFQHSSALTRLEAREQGIEYYCHVDPANRSDYYAIAVSHAVPTGSLDGSGMPIKRFVIDHIQYWAPIQMKQPVQASEIEEYLVTLHQNFRFRQISFDQWHSSEMMEKLASRGLPVILKVFNKEYKDKIYIHLLEVFRDKRISFYKMSGGRVSDKNGRIIEINEIPEAKDQFTFLQKKWRNGKQVIEALTSYKDDICDAVAAVIYECNSNNNAKKQLPKTRLAYTGQRFR